MELDNLGQGGIVPLLQQMAAIKKDYLDGKIDKRGAARYVDTLLRRYGLIGPETDPMEAADLPDEFWLPCDCLFCRATRGEAPIPLEGVLQVENLRMACKLGWITMGEAAVRIQAIFQAYGVKEQDAVKFWLNNQQQGPHTGMAGAMKIAPMTDSEANFFKGLEEQMKDVPPEGVK